MFNAQLSKSNVQSIKNSLVKWEKDQLNLGGCQTGMETSLMDSI
jgi:hypothetical protein